MEADHNVQAGDTVRFRKGREGTFQPGTHFVVTEVFPSGEWFTADVGRTGFFLRVDRVEVVKNG